MSTPSSSVPKTTGTLATLRDLAPNRAMSQTEAIHFAELQANKLLELSAVHDPPVPDSVITNIPKVAVKRVSPWPVSGCTDWTKGTWTIVINSAEPILRQRFTLAHEFKHILDYRYIDVAYPTTTFMGHHQRVEAVCDYFAGCLLVPERFLKDAWERGVRTLPELSSIFGVSQAAIQTRLIQTGLAGPQPRCTDRAENFRFHRSRTLEPVR